MSFTEQDLLDAMDGIILILDHDLRITSLGCPNWQRFLDDNPPQDATVGNRGIQDVLGSLVTQFIAGDVVRETFAELFRSVLSGARPFVQISYRCDAPTLRRDMRLSVKPITTGGNVNHLHYQSVVLSVEPRPAIQLFGARVADQDAEDILTVCSICARVAWPVGAPTGVRRWVEPSEYYRRGGADVVLISHGFCEACFARLQDEN